MDEDVFGKFYSRMTPYNPDIANGFAFSQLDQAPEYVGNKFKQDELNSFPKGLKYIGHEICSPEKTYQVMSNIKHRTKNYYDITHSDVYLVRYMFTWYGQPLKSDVYFLLPYARPGGWMTLKDSQYHIAPVLADIAISVTGDGLFVRLKMPVKIYREHHKVLVDDVRESLSVIWSRIHNNKAKSTKTSLMHYLLSKHGLSSAFKIYAGCDIVLDDADHVNRANYPEEDWVICKTAVAPYNDKGAVRKINRRTDARIAIPRDKWNNLTAGMVAGFFYLADQFPEQVLVKNELDNPTIWKMLLGTILFGPGAGIGKIIANMDSHLESVDTYLTDISKRWLEMEDVFVNNVYELFAELIESYSRRVSASSDRISTMYGKRFVVLYYVLYDIIAAINRVNFDFQSIGLDKVTENDVCRIFRDRLRLTAIMSLSGQEHKEVSSIGSTTDSLIYKLSMPNILQTNTSRAKQAKDLEVTFGEESVQHASVAEYGNPNVNPEKEPTGRQRSNLYAITDDQGILHRRDKNRQIIDETQERIKR